MSIPERPITSILNTKFRYTPAAETDVGKRIKAEIKRLAAEAKPQRRVVVLVKK